jgi:hypothetical protein
MAGPGRFMSGINTILERNTPYTASEHHDFISEWRNRLRALLSHKTAETVQFLMSDPSANLHDAAICRRYNEVLSKYANPLLSVTSSMHDLTLVRPTIQLDISAIPICKLIRNYIRTGEDLQAIEESLQEKLATLDAAAASLHQMMTLDPDSISPSLTEAVSAYLHRIFEKNAIESTYRAFVETYGRFVALRSVISLPTEVQKPNGPACTICMTKEVSHAIAPCGHTFCDLCSAKQLTSCYICRTQIRDRLRIYY